MLRFKLLDARYQLEDAVGFIPDFVDPADPRRAEDQFAERYCGGWHGMKVGKGGFTAFDDYTKLHYPGDPPLHALAEASIPASSQRPQQRIVVYESAFVAIIDQDGADWRVSRLD